MILYEFEGKKILSENGIAIPKFQIVESVKDKVKLKPPFILKAQVLSGKRKDAGGIVFVENSKDLKQTLKELFGKVVNKEKAAKVLVEEKVPYAKEFYISICYDTNFRGPVATYSEKGGTGVEERKSVTFPIDILAAKILYPKNLRLPKNLKTFLQRLSEIFLKEDATLVEVNPAVVSKVGKVLALDAKIKLDDLASARRSEWHFSPRAIPGHTLTRREIMAKKIDEGDYRGTAGSTYFDLPGDIAILASGGGASLTAMDALQAAGGKPANYTEYSGNPPKEKVEKLTKIVLSKKGLHGLWVVGAIANFTNIYETLSGFLEALRKVKPKPAYPIVIRRGGPKDKEAFNMLRKVKDFDLHLYGEEISMTESAEIMARLARKYATTS